MSRRVLFIWFPHLAAERRLRRESWLDPSRPFATLKKQAGAWRLSSVTPAAARIGLAPGASLADAKAVAPRLATAPEEPERVQAFLSALGRWCWRYTPWIA
ncbi:MAG: DNA polymerase Y family protein, partial [Pseudomonadota bacterium]